MARTKRKQAPAPDNSQVMLATVLPPETRRHGDYHVAPISVVEGEFDGVIKGEMSVVRNFAADPVVRWTEKGILTSTERAAIDRYRSEWAFAFGKLPSLTMKWLDADLIRGANSISDANERRIDAKKRLDEFDDEVFTELPKDHFWVWQNVVIFDEPLGIIGSRLGFINATASQIMAQTIVKGVASKLADHLGLGND